MLNNSVYWSRSEGFVPFLWNKLIIVEVA